MKDTYKLLLDNETIQSRVSDMGKEITSKLASEDLCIVCVLNGAIMFFADLVRCIRADKIDLCCIAVSSYADNKITDKISFCEAKPIDCKNKTVLVCEDIVDSGRTINSLKSYFANKGASSVYVACMIDKPRHRKVDEVIDFVGFELATERFLVGYGLDDASANRQLDCIYEIID